MRLTERSTSDTTSRADVPLPPLLAAVLERMLRELHGRLADAGFADVRPGHDFVFRFVPSDGIRLTELAELAEMTKQSCAEVIDSLQALGYAERVPDPDDGRAKIIRLTESGQACQETAHRLLADIEHEWGERVGDARVTAMREVLTEIAGGGARVAIPT